MILQKILEAKKAEVEEIIEKKMMKQWERALPDLPPTRNFQKALQSAPAIVAEVKHASPSRGRLREDFAAAGIACAYELGGAAAVSVLTDERFFSGHINHLKEVRAAATLPILRKDFIINEAQLWESRAGGADAILLIAAILKEEHLKTLIGLSRELTLAPLVEIHSERELALALRAGADIIGVNNRNLASFQTDISLSLKLAPLIPPEVLLISESGIATRADIELLMAAGIKAFLIGEALMTAAKPEIKLRELLGKGLCS